MLCEDLTARVTLARKLPWLATCRVISQRRCRAFMRPLLDWLFKGSPFGGLAGTAFTPPRASAYSSNRLLFFCSPESRDDRQADSGRPAIAPSSPLRQNSLGVFP